ncbi:hypothetical protein [Desulfosarcina sp.]|uniref:hypothetical protein n=1 Tax=Desulfosarcina sp. TaxID=2027861 RepID=UPI0035671B67
MISDSFLLKIGVNGVSEHDAVHSEDEIKSLLSLAGKPAELSRIEHRLLKPKRCESRVGIEP